MYLNLLPGSNISRDKNTLEVEENISFNVVGIQIEELEKLDHGT